MPTPPLSAEEIDRRRVGIEQALRDGYAPMGIYGGKGSAVQEAARRMGLDAGTLTASVRKGHVVPDWKLYTPGEAAQPAAIPAVSETEIVREEMRQLKARVRLIEKERLTEEFVRQQVFGLAAQSPEPPNWLVSMDEGGSAGVPTVFWSDWHWSEVVRAAEVGGVNAFDSDIAKTRVQRLVDRTINLCFSHMVGTDYPGIVVAIGGDMLSGVIHDELTETNDRMMGPAWLELLEVMIWALGQTADAFGQVFVPAVVGNHPRMTHRPRAKGRVHTNYEWLLYCALERHFANDSRIQFLIPGEADAHYRVYQHRYMLTHGDSLGVKGGDGIIGALGPVMRGRVKLHTSEAQIGREFDTLLMGHWHQYLPMPGLIVNGSLKGYDEYARLFLRARYQPPIQALWFTSAKRGVTAHWPVYLEDDTGSRHSEDWISWAA